MNARQTRRVSRRRSGNRPTLRITLIAAGACVPVAVVGYTLTAATGGPVTDTAYGSPYGARPHAYAVKDDGGWGRGGYTMMPGPFANAAVANAATMSSENWAGYAAAGNQGTFTSVAASWAQPTVTCGTAQTFSSYWVGLDGDGTPTVEQTGTEADCDGGAAVYQGWFEMFPAAPVFYDNPVQAGDAMSASVTANGDGTFTLTLADATQGWTQTTKQASNQAQLGSAEVIVEAPSDGNVLPLSDFGTASFTNATADNQPIGNADPSALVMASPTAGTEATPSALNGGNAFSVTFDGNGGGGGGGGGAGQGTGNGDGTGTGTGTGPGDGAGGATGTTPTTVTVPGRYHRHHHGG